MVIFRRSFFAGEKQIFVDIFFSFIKLFSESSGNFFLREEMGFFSSFCSAQSKEYQ
jgi:hypothetical protein